jgi:biotin operon repressor
MTVRVDHEAATAKSRLVHLSLLGLNLRLMENWRSMQIAAKGTALDYESTMILMAIIVICAGKLLRTGLEADLESLASPFPEQLMSKANLSSVAEATGINRETVRRKVNDLQKAGFVVRDREGIRTANNGPRLEALQEIIGAQLGAIASTVNQLSRLGVLTKHRPAI